MKKNKYLLILIVPLLFSCSTKKNSSSYSEESNSSSSISESCSSSTNESQSSSSSSSSASSSTSSSTYSSTSSSEEHFDDRLWDNSQNYLRNGSKDINFYNLNDTHGTIEESSNEPGIARISTYLSNEKAKNPAGYVLTSSGDMWQGSADSNITRGRLMLDWMDYEGFSAMSLGNHEFDWTIDIIKTNSLISNTPFLACNIIDTDLNAPVDWVEPYTTITRNGVHIGIIGAIGEGITTDILATNVKGLKFDKPDRYVAEHARYLRDNGADVILLLYHFSVFKVSSTLASYVDAIFGGHNHKLERTLINNTPAVEGQNNGKYVSNINLRYNFETKSCGYLDYGYHAVDLSLKENPEVIEIKNKYADEIDVVKNVEVAYLTTYMDKYYGLPTYYNQSALRYYNEYYGERSIYAVITNNSRAPLNTGLVTYGDIYKSLPFDNFLTLFNATGYNIKKITTYANSHWYIPSVSEEHISPEMASSYFDDDTEYYILTIDYISMSEGYTSWMNIENYFFEEEALPRNIVANYLAIDYPLE